MGSAGEPDATGLPGGKAGGGTAPATTTGGPGGIKIVVNRSEYEVSGPDMAPEEIKRMAGAPPHHTLILVAGSPGGAGGEPRPDGSGPIRIERGMRFWTVNSPEFACAAGARRPSAPRARPLLAPQTRRSR